MATDPTVTEFLARRAAAQGNLIPLSALAEVPAELRDLTGELGGVISTVNMVEIATPSNAATQEGNFKDEYRAGITQNPQFLYPLARDTDTAAMRTTLTGLRDRAGKVTLAADNRAGAWFQGTLLRLIADALLTADAIDGMAGREVGGLRGNALTTKAFAGKYWGLDPALLAAAQEDYTLRCTPATLVTGQNGKLTDEQKDRLRSMRFSAAATVKVLEWALGRCGLLRQRGEPGPGFCIVVSEDAKALDVRHRSSEGRCVFVPADSVSGPRDTGLDIITVVGEHEIRGHAQNAANGWQLFGICGGGVTGDDETFYEGVAMWNEDRALAELFGKEETTWPWPYVYPAAVSVAQSGGSFHDVAEDTIGRYLRVMLKVPAGGAVKLNDLSGEAEREAAIHAGWRTAYRVKRGLRGTNAQSGVFSKDLAYMRGKLLQEGMDDAGLGHVTRAMVVPGRVGLLSLAEWDIPESALPYNQPSFALELAGLLLDGTLGN